MYDLRSPDAAASVNPKYANFRFGKVRLRLFVVSMRDATASCGAWPYDDRRALEAARQAYNAGTHDMVQGRDGEVIIQYLIPLRDRRPASRYFEARR